MFPFHVVLDQPRTWLDYLPCVTALAALTTVVVAICIARNQSEMQKEQVKLQTMQLDLQARELKKDLFDRRFAVFTAVD